jgi:hypothetical protein
MDQALPDTDIPSEVFNRKGPQVLAKARQYLAQYLRFSFVACPIDPAALPA